MKKHLRVIVNGKPYDVEIEDLAQRPVTVLVNGTPYNVEIEAPGVSNSEVEPGPAVTVGGTAPVVSAAPAAASSPAQNANTIIAPMPGVILDINVKVGDKVVRGQHLCALEAMKMKSAIRSPKEGVIASVDVCEGARVPYGTVLFRFA